VKANERGFGCIHKRTFLGESSCVLLDTGLAGAWARTSGEERRRQKTRSRTATKEKKGHLEAIAGKVTVCGNCACSFDFCWMRYKRIKARRKEEQKGEGVEGCGGRNFCVCV